MTPRRTAQTAHFQELMATGRLRPGMSRAEVRVLLGEPEAVGGTSRRYRTPCCFKYGDIQLFFGQRASEGLQMVFSEDEEGQDGFTLSWPAQPSPGTSFAPGEQYGDFGGTVFSASASDRLALSSSFLDPLFRALLERSEKPRLLAAWNEMEGWAAPNAGRTRVQPEETQELVQAIQEITAADLARHCSGCSVAEAMGCATTLREFLAEQLARETELFIEAT